MAKNPEKRRCGNCKHFRVRVNPKTGRKCPSCAGHCGWPVPWPEKWPMCYRIHAFAGIEWPRPPVPNSHVWAIDNASDCRTWEPGQAEASPQKKLPQFKDIIGLYADKKE